MQLNTITQNNKKTLIIFVAIMCLLCTLMACIPLDNLLTPTADAWYNKPYNQLNYEQRLANVEEKAGKFAGFAFSVVCISEGIHPDFSWANISKDIFKTGRFEFKLLGRTVNFATMGKGIYDSMKVVGIALIFLYFLIEILDEVQADHFSIEHLIKKLITLTVAMLVLNQGGTLFSYIIELSDPLIDLVSDSIVANASAPISQLAYTAFTETKEGIFSSILVLITAIGYMSSQLIPALFTLVAVIIAYLVGYSRYFEIMLRFAFAPIGLAQLVSGGAKGAGMRYIKKFASAVIQGAVCVAVFGVIPILSSSADLGAIIGKIIVPLTAIGVLMKAPRIADDICGV